MYRSFCAVVIISNILNQGYVVADKRLLVDDRDYVQSSLHQLQLDIQDLKTKLAEKDIHMVQMQNVVHGLADRLTQKDSQVESLQNSLTEKNNQITNLTQQMSVLINQVSALQESNRPIAFYAHLSGDLQISSMSTHQTIIYNVVELNLGNGYNRVNGHFTAPASGTYVFHITTATLDRSHASVELVLNNVVKDVSWADSMDHDDRASASTSTPLTLKSGDVVLARIGSAFGGKVLEDDVYIRCSFSGVRLY